VSKSHEFGQQLITNHFSNVANDVNMLESTEQIQQVEQAADDKNK
jgi:hypothetical protein